MPTYQPQLPFTEMTTTEYAKAMGISDSTVRRRCEQGLLDAYKLNDDLSGSRWVIKVPKGDTVSRAQYERLLRENSELKTVIALIRKLLERDSWPDGE